MSVTLSMMLQLSWMKPPMMVDLVAVNTPRGVVDRVRVDDRPEAPVVVDRAGRSSEILSVPVDNATGVRLVVAVLVDLSVEPGLEHVVAERVEEVGEHRPALVAVEVQVLDEPSGTAGEVPDHVAVARPRCTR